MGDSQTTVVAHLDVGLLAKDRCNPRKVEPDATELVDLASSIKTTLGVVEPLLVRPLPGGRYGVVCGSRRLAAARAVGLGQVPCVVREDLDDPMVIAIGLAENVARASLNPVEEAHAYDLLIDTHGWSKARLAEHVGVSVATVSGRLKLVRLPQGVQDKVADGTMTIGRALKFSDRVAQVRRGTRDDPPPATPPPAAHQPPCRPRAPTVKR